MMNPCALHLYHFNLETLTEPKLVNVPEGYSPTAEQTEMGKKQTDRNSETENYLENKK